mmetsp:Transcript_12775/g.22824  ORF Transcript_12775/g.22824 Transcript_12775/m.22824 type:complete len:82 (-) Transcript_12775:25-270(-)
MSMSMTMSREKGKARQGSAAESLEKPGQSSRRPHGAGSVTSTAFASAMGEVFKQAGKQASKQAFCYSRGVWMIWKNKDDDD